MMKKYISLILVASMAMMLFTGCRETQDAPAEMQKDQEQMLQTAEQGGDNSALLAALDVPEHFTGEWEGVNGRTLALSLREASSEEISRRRTWILFSVFS